MGYLSGDRPSTIKVRCDRVSINCQAAWHWLLHSLLADRLSSVRYLYCERSRLISVFRLVALSTRNVLLILSAIVHDVTFPQHVSGLSSVTVILCMRTPGLRQVSSQRPGRVFSEHRYHVQVPGPHPMPAWHSSQSIRARLCSGRPQMDQSPVHEG